LPRSRWSLAMTESGGLFFAMMKEMDYFADEIVSQ
jgi:hypothetical protein